MRYVQMPRPGACAAPTREHTSTCVTQPVGITSSLQVKRLVGNVRRRKKEATVAGAPEPSTPVTSHLATTAPPTTAVLYQGRRHTVAGELKAEALHSGAGRAPAGAHGVQWDASMRKGRGGNHGATIASPVGKGFARNANFRRT